jgi:hypothetical protein
LAPSRFSQPRRTSDRIKASPCPLPPIKAGFTAPVSSREMRGAAWARSLVSSAPARRISASRVSRSSAASWARTLNESRVTPAAESKAKMVSATSSSTRVKPWLLTALLS